MVALPTASEIKPLTWNPDKTAAAVEAALDEFYGVVWTRLDAVVGKTYSLFANGWGATINDATFTVYNAAGQTVLAANLGVADTANITPTSNGPLFIALSSRTGTPADISLGISTTTLTNKFLSTFDDDTYTGTFGERIFGTWGADTLTLGNAMQASGGEDNDTIYGNNFANTMWGDQGNDFILSGGGVGDVIWGGSGRDNIQGNAAGTVWVDGGSGNDSIDLFGATSGTAYGGAGSDLLAGSDGTDLLFGGDNGDRIYGGIGDDRIYGDDGNDYLFGNAGIDRISGGIGNDRISGDADDDALYGGDGDDTVSGGDGVDRISGGVGQDILNGDAAADTISGEDGNDIISGGEGNDTLSGANGDDGFYGGNGDDAINGGAGNDVLNGEAGNDRLTGDAGRDTLSGGNGADTFAYRSTADSTLSSTGRDIITSFSRTDGDSIDLSAIDANSKASGNQAFAFISTSGFHKIAGELRYAKASGDTFVYGDVNGDGVAEFSIRIDADVSLRAADFVL